MRPSDCTAAQQPLASRIRIRLLTFGPPLRALVVREWTLAARRGARVFRHQTKGLLWLTLWAGGAGLLLALFRFAPTPSLHFGLMGMAFCLGRGTWGLLEDRWEGRQSLLRLTGLGPASVFLGSVIGSLWLVLEPWLVAIPIVYGMFVWRPLDPPEAIGLVALVTGLLICAASLALLGRCYTRTPTGGYAAGALAAFLVLILPLTLDLFLGNHLNDAVRRGLDLWTGLPAWRQLDDEATGRGLGPATLEANLRVIGWSVLFFALAFLKFRADWRLAEEGSRARERKSRRESAPQSSALRSLLLNESPYAWLMSRGRGWPRALYALAAVFALIAISFMGLTSWSFFPVWAMAMLGATDALSHLAVAQATAADRQEGRFELLLTTPLKPAEIFSGATLAGRHLVQTGIRAAVPLGLLLMSLSAIRIPENERAMPQTWIAWAVVWLWPILYGWSLNYLDLELPAWQGANTGQPIHQASPPHTSALMPAVALVMLLFFGLWSASGKVAAAIVGVVIFGFWLVLRDYWRGSQLFTPEDLRLVAQAPIPDAETLAQPRPQPFKPILP